MHEHGINHKHHLRQTVEGILYRTRVGCAWRNLPRPFGRWNSVYQAFNRWSLSEKLIKVLYFLAKDPDLEWEFIDGSFVKAHQHSSSAARDKDQAIGKSFGLPIAFDIMHQDHSLYYPLLSDSP